MRALRIAHRGDWRRAPENTLSALLGSSTTGRTRRGRQARLNDRPAGTSTIPGRTPPAEAGADGAPVPATDP